MEQNMVTRAEQLKTSQEREVRLHMQVLSFTTEMVVPAINMNMPGERYEIKISPIEIRANYGDNCEKIFRMLFTMHQVGGRSEEWKTSYKTLWVLNQQNLDKFSKIIDGLRGTKYSGKQIKEAMIAAGCAESRRVKLGGEPEVLSGEALDGYKKLVTHLRSLERLEVEHASATYF